LLFKLLIGCVIATDDVEIPYVANVC